MKIKLISILITIIFLASCSNNSQEADFNVNQNTNQEQDNTEEQANYQENVFVQDVSQNQEASELAKESEKSSLITKIQDKVTEKVAEVVDQVKDVVPTKDEKGLPSKKILEVDFASQAPFGNWDEVHEETCEEASMIMADSYYRHYPLDEQTMEDMLMEVLEYLEEKGYGLDLEAQDVVDVLKDYYGLDSYIIENPTVEDIKRVIVNNQLVIVPAAGRLLENPYYSGEGPLYHMFLIKGYDSDDFITNDPGTRRGDGFKFSYQNVMESIHEWNNGDVYNGARKIVVLNIAN